MQKTIEESCSVAAEERLLQELQLVLIPQGQQHLLQFWEELTSEQQQSLADQIRSIDFCQLNRLIAGDVASSGKFDDQANVNPPAARRLGQSSSTESSDARRAGESLLRSGKCGVVIVAGGQGSRLGFDHPKGMFPVGPVSDATLFQILIEKIRATANRFATVIPLYLMTSPATHQETVEFLDANNRFGLNESELIVFCQGIMPGVDNNGKLVLASKDTVFLSPDGHGGMLSAMKVSGALADMSDRGIEHLFYCQIDNPLVDLLGTEFLGYHLLANSDVTTQVVAKQDSSEKVGNVVEIDGRLQIIEYSDLPQAMAEVRQPNGDLRLWAGNLAVHAFRVAFLQRSCEGDCQLPFHVARKKIPYTRDDGIVVKPTEANGIKFEQFIFDLLPMARNALVVEVSEQEVFAPLKNAEGKDSPDYVRNRISELHRSWLLQAGVEIPETMTVEISPLAAISPEDLRVASLTVPGANEWHIA